MARIRYFAWVRERVGVEEEEIALPETVRDGEGLIAFLKARHEGAAEAFASPALRLAVNQEMVPRSAPISDGDEIAFFPPLTGG